MLQQFVQFASKNPYIIVYVIAFYCSMKYYRKYFDTVLRNFPMLIAYTFLNELLGYFIREYPEYQLVENQNISFYNVIIYNIWEPIFFLYFFLVYFKTVENPIYRSIIQIGALILILSQIINAVLKNPLYEKLSWASIISSFMLITAVLLYLKERKVITNYKWEQNNLLVWISFGLLCYFSIYPFLIYVGYIDNFLFSRIPFFLIVNITVALLYGFFCIGFIKSSRRAFR